MAADYIKINRAKTHGNSLVRLADLIREVREQAEKLKDSANHMVDGSNHDLLEDMFGLEEGTGPNTITLVNIIDGIFNTDTDVEGSVRLDQINEFVARLAGQ